MSTWMYAWGILISGLIYLGLFLGGLWTWSFVVLIFVLLPLLELIFPAPKDTLSEADYQKRSEKQWQYDIWLYLAVPLQYGLLFTYLWQVSKGDLQGWTYIGMSLSVAIACGGYGINVAHELGHRTQKMPRFASLMLLLTALYMHFYIEHNKGHHAKIATPEDPASARKDESLYAFWWRSVTQSWLSAWEIESSALARKHVHIFSPKNLMLQLIFVQISFIAMILFIFGIQAMFSFIGVAVLGFLLLETVNYIEHYGLARKKKENDKGYERVLPMHSWNSNHLLGRIFLFDLPRHSDHHAHSKRPYSTLRHFDDSPQLPTGYLGMILLAFFPPVFKRVMHQQLDREMQRLNHQTASISS